LEDLARRAAPDSNSGNAIGDKPACSRSTTTGHALIAWAADRWKPRSGFGDPRRTAVATCMIPYAVIRMNMRDGNARLSA
jgi:hypothetical protein